MSKYQTKIGLEVHVQLATKSKMFCGCENDNEKTDPNILVCPICMGYPGTLPVINKKAIELAAKTALSLDCEVQNFVRFDRKNYFYPDLPKGYQITQFFYPIGLDGELKGVGIERVHLEEDTAKMVHAGNDSLIDYNRAGIPLLEIVSRPDITSPKQASEYLKKLRDILVRGGFSAARMQLGEFRCDANISTLNEAGEQLGEVVEIKNINSFRNVALALEYEHKRQSKELSQGVEVIKETRGFDVKSGETYSQRVKEKAHDYRYFPEPDLPPLELKQEQIDLWKNGLVVSEEELSKKLKKEYNFSDEILKVLVRHENEDVRLLLLNLLDVSDGLDDSALKRRASMFVLEELWVKVKNGKWDLHKLKDDIKGLSLIVTKYALKEADKETTIKLIEGTILGDKTAADIVQDDLTEQEIGKLFDNFLIDNPEQKDLWQSNEKKKAVENFFIGYVKRNSQGRGEVEKILKVFAGKINN